MNKDGYRIIVGANDDRSSSQGARSLSDCLREVQGVLDVGRAKGDGTTMDLGSIVTVVASSTATLAIANGIADWLRRTRGTVLRIERNSASESVKVAVENIDPEAALRIAESVLGA